MKKITILFLNVIFVNLLFSNSFKLHLLFTNNIHGAIHEVPARFINPEFSPILAGGAGAFTYASKIRKEAKLKEDLASAKKEVLISKKGFLTNGPKENPPNHQID